MELIVSNIFVNTALTLLMSLEKNADFVQATNSSFDTKTMWDELEDGVFLPRDSNTVLANLMTSTSGGKMAACSIDKQTHIRI